MHFIKWLSSSGVDSTMTCSWHSCWYLSCARASVQVMCSEPAYHDIAFSKVRGTHKSSVSVFSTSSMCLEPKFPQNSHVSHIWHHLGIFREGCVWLEAFLASCSDRVSPSILLCQHTNYMAASPFCFLRAGSRYISGQFWPLILRVCYGDYHGPIEGNKAALKESTNVLAPPRQSCRARALSSGLTQPN